MAKDASGDFGKAWAERLPHSVSWRRPWERQFFSFTATEPHDRSQIDAAFEKWLPRLERALIDSLGNLIGEYEKAVREHPNAPVEDLDYLIWRLREALRIRNVLCHGSWQEPDSVLSNAT